MLRQRVYALALGEEDLNDHSELRHDLTLRAAVGRDAELASPSTLRRMERRANRDAALSVERHENWLEGSRYLNMDFLAELKKEQLREAA